MAADYILPESAAPTAFEKTIRVLIILAVLSLAGVLIWFLGIAPFRAFSKIDIIGGEEQINSPALQAEGLSYFGISRAAILLKAGITLDSSYVSANVPAMEKALMGIVSFESVRVFKHFPDRLQIVLEGRKPVASALADIDGRTVPVLFDSQGVVFQIGGDIRKGTFNRQLPLISGLIIEDPVPGMRLPVIFTSLFKELEKIGNSAPELLAAVSELRINRRSFDGFDLILYPVNKKVKVRISEINEDLLRYTLLMVDVLASREDGIETLDFRAGIASYVPKEASSE